MGSLWENVEKYGHLWNDILNIVLFRQYSKCFDDVLSMHWNSKFNQDPAFHYNDMIFAALNRA